MLQCSRTVGFDKKIKSMNEVCRANMSMTSDNLLECKVMSNTIHMQEIGVVTCSYYIQSSNCSIKI